MADDLEAHSDNEGDEVEQESINSDDEAMFDSGQSDDCVPESDSEEPQVAPKSRRNRRKRQELRIPIGTCHVQTCRRKFYTLQSYRNHLKMHLAEGTSTLIG